ncbi:unnamed protein product [Pedinophyceae sp. YPF-701]|nr:unnamed protein product [Pedinophyceae sp. YPF-701]
MLRGENAVGRRVGVRAAGGELRKACVVGFEPCPHILRRRKGKGYNILRFDDGAALRGPDLDADDVVWLDELKCDESAACGLCAGHDGPCYSDAPKNTFEEDAEPAGGGEELGGAPESTTLTMSGLQLDADEDLDAVKRNLYRDSDLPAACEAAPAPAPELHPAGSGDAATARVKLGSLFAPAVNAAGRKLLGYRPRTDTPVYEGDTLANITYGLRSVPHSATFATVEPVARNAVAADESSDSDSESDDEWQAGRCTRNQLRQKELRRQQRRLRDDPCEGWAELREACVYCTLDDNAHLGKCIGPRSMWVCSGCGARTAHKQCEEAHRAASLPPGSEVPELTLDDDWFCTDACQAIHCYLRDVDGARQPVHPQDVPADTPQDAAHYSLEVSSYMGPTATAASRATVEAAFGLFCDAFNPIPLADGGDLIRAVCTGAVREAGGGSFGYDFEDFRVAVLRLDTGKGGVKVVSAAALRISGESFAEVPFVATKEGFRRCGHYTVLMRALERTLTELRVRFLVVPGHKSIFNVWCARGFERTSPAEQHALSGRLVQLESTDAVTLKKPLYATTLAAEAEARRKRRRERKRARLEAATALLECGSSQEREAGGGGVAGQEAGLRRTGARAGLAGGSGGVAGGEAGACCGGRARGARRSQVGGEFRLEQREV